MSKQGLVEATGRQNITSSAPEAEWWIDSPFRIVISSAVIDISWLLLSAPPMHLSCIYTRGDSQYDPPCPSADPSLHAHLNGTKASKAQTRYQRNRYILESVPNIANPVSTCPNMPVWCVSIHEAGIPYKRKLRDSKSRPPSFERLKIKAPAKKHRPAVMLSELIHPG